jgi:hypothetical protein
MAYYSGQMAQYLKDIGSMGKLLVLVFLKHQRKKFLKECGFKTRAQVSMYSERLTALIDKQAKESKYGLTAATTLAILTTE